MNDPTHSVRLFAIDIDNVLEKGTADGLFAREWDALHAKARPLLAYNSGRNVEDAKWRALDGQIPSPEFIIGSLGTEVYDPVDASVGRAFAEYIAPGWDRAAVARIVDEFAGPRPQAAEFLSEFKLSWYWPRATHADRARLELTFHEAGLQVSVLYTENVFLDVVPARAGKGKALAWLCNRIGVPLEGVLVTGAAANNSEMFNLAGVRGFLLRDGSGELYSSTVARRPFMTTARGPDGVIAGLRHFGVIAPVSAGETSADRLVGVPGAR